MMPATAFTRYEAERDAELKASRTAIWEGRDKLPTGSSFKAVIWHLLQEAAETLASLPDKERTWLLSADRSGWPEVYHTAQEHYEAELQRLVDLKMSKEEAPLPRRTITDPAAVRRMLTVLGWLQYVHGKRPKRDRMVVLAMAMKQPAQRIRIMMGGNVTDFAALAVKGKVLKQIEKALHAQGLV